jgi:hypothetical protein
VYLHPRILISRCAILCFPPIPGFWARSEHRRGCVASAFLATPPFQFGASSSCLISTRVHRRFYQSCTYSLAVVVLVVKELDLDCRECAGGACSVGTGKLPSSSSRVQSYIRLDPKLQGTSFSWHEPLRTTRFVQNCQIPTHHEAQLHH